MIRGILILAVGILVCCFWVKVLFWVPDIESQYGVVFMGLLTAGPIIVAGLYRMVIAKEKRQLMSSADRRIAEQQCYKCGYDLRGNESGRCPECGARVERS